MNARIGCASLGVGAVRCARGDFAALAAVVVVGFAPRAAVAVVDFAARAVGTSRAELAGVLAIVFAGFVGLAGLVAFVADFAGRVAGFLLAIRRA